MECKKAVIVTKDLLKDLKSICYSLTKNNRIDFATDESIIKEEAEKPEKERDILLWMAYPSGTHCLKERDVFLKDSEANMSWLFYDKQMSDAPKIAYAVKIDGIKDGLVLGILYELDFKEHCRIVKERAVAADYIHYQYENGGIECSAKLTYNQGKSPNMGKLLYHYWMPNDSYKHHLVLMTEQICRDGSNAKMGLELKMEIESSWNEALKKHEAGEVCRCFRCGRELDKKLSHNSISRYADVYVCSICGMEEAIGSVPDHYPLNFKEWAVLTEESEPSVFKNTLSLGAKCFFNEVFEKRNARGIPLSEVCYSRSDYTGRQWWTSWFVINDKEKEKYVSEIDGFMNALRVMPEFANLRTMRRASVAAGLTSDPTEFNLFSETYNFYIWIRMILREGDYNLYVHYFSKDLVGKTAWS